MTCHCEPNYNYETGKVKVSDYMHDNQPNWCAGCGDFAIWAAIKRALVELEIAPHDVLLCFDIGCNGNMSDKIRGYRIHSLHGRVLPVAVGAKIANPNLKVIAFAGDGATYSEGISHFVNSIKSNYPITFVVHNNGNYGLTTGQASATTPQGAKRNGSPDGPVAQTLNPLELAFSLDPSFVARGFSGNIKQLVSIFKEAISYQDNGFAYVDVLQSCPTYNKEMTHEWYLGNTYDLNDNKHDLTNIELAKDLAKNTTDKIATGLIYKNNINPTYLNRLQYRKDFQTTLVQEVHRHDISEILDTYK
jgi:2-oxoglutarate ferredoxin oxidoreductase subunit beta